MLFRKYPKTHERLKFGPLALFGLQENVNGSGHAFEAHKNQKIEKVGLLQSPLFALWEINNQKFFPIVLWSMKNHAARLNLKRKFGPSEEFKRLKLFKRSRNRDPTMWIFLKISQNLLRINCWYLTSQPWWAFQTRLPVWILIVEPIKTKNLKEKKWWPLNKRVKHCSSALPWLRDFSTSKGGGYDGVNLQKLGSMNSLMQFSLYYQTWIFHGSTKSREESSPNDGHQTCPESTTVLA